MLLFDHGSLSKSFPRVWTLKPKFLVVNVSPKQSCRVDQRYPFTLASRPRFGEGLTRQHSRLGYSKWRRCFICHFPFRKKRLGIYESKLQFDLCPQNSFTRSWWCALALLLCLALWPLLFWPADPWSFCVEMHTVPDGPLVAETGKMGGKQSQGYIVFL